MNLRVISRLFKKLKREYKIFRFSGSQDYWENRYSGGGNSGHGSYGKQSRYKAERINSFISEHGIQSIIDFGCGDGNNIGLLKGGEEYVGLDVSRKAIEICRSKYKDDASKTFRVLDRPFPEMSIARSDLSLSLDVIFHLVEDPVFEQYMSDLFSASERYVIIYATNFDDRSSAHVRHRAFVDFIASNYNEWSLLRKEENPYSARKKELSDTVEIRNLPDFYFYVRKDRL